MPKRIFVGISGGVDSSVAAYLLKQAGYEITGVFMKNWEETDPHGNCPFERDLKDAEMVCHHLQIPLQVVNFSENYWQDVFTHFLHEYESGRTPNPDILCNQTIKFRAFLDYALAEGAEAIATGHYARIHETPTGVRLQKGLDSSKDQSYFLHTLSQSQLKHAHFPVGHLAKSQVRKIAKDLKLVTSDKKDSTGICFIGERRFKTFLENYLPANPGDIVTDKDEVIGRHQGLMYYTIGQRQGLAIGGQKGKVEAPWYVASKDLIQNRLMVVQGDHPALYQESLSVATIHWIHEPPCAQARLFAKIRYRQEDQACTLEQAPDGRYRVTFQEKQRAVTPGQSVVFYDGETCLGGGVIL